MVPDRSADASPPPGSGRALRSLPSATLALCSAAAFLVLVTLLSFVPEGGPSPGQVVAGGAADTGGTGDTAGRHRAADAASHWSLRGPLPPPDAPPLHERIAQRAPS